MDLHELAVNIARRILATADTEDPDNVKAAQELLKELERSESESPATTRSGDSETEV